MLNRRQLRIKALEVVYAYDKSIEKNIDFQIKYFLKSNHNFFKLYITCFLSLIHISEPTRQAEISYAVFCLKKKKKK